MIESRPQNYIPHPTMLYVLYQQIDPIADTFASVGLKRVSGRVYTWNGGQHYPLPAGWTIVYNYKD